MKFYFYKMTTDDGGAPCVAEALLSLAICKPMIRSAATEGSMILGFAANELCSDNRLIYIAKVTRKVSGNAYYSGKEFKQRADCIYESTKDGFLRRSDAKFHGSESDLTHDLGLPPSYKRAWVLLSEGFEHFRYFGTARPDDYKARNPYLKREIESLTQGHRVNHEPALRKELERLCDNLFAEPHSSQNSPVPGAISSRKCHDCSQDDDFIEC